MNAQREYRPLSDIEISSEIRRISELLDWQVGEIAQRARAAADARVGYKLAQARALLAQDEGTVDQKAAKALLACATEYALSKGADAVLLAAQEAGRTLRSQIEALRTLAASQRAALTYATGEGRRP